MHVADVMWKIEKLVDAPISRNVRKQRLVMNSASLSENVADGFL